MSEGAVYVGGRDVRHYEIHSLRDAVSIILQKNVLFFGTVRDNLKWGNPEATDEEIWEACRAACADEFLNRMPDGLDTMLEQGAGNLSGGQKQRLCIARALVGKAKILIFDDSTSAVDTATEKKNPGGAGEAEGCDQDYYCPEDYLCDEHRPDCDPGGWQGALYWNS